MLRSRSKLIFPGEEKGEGREGGGDQGERAGRQISRGVAGGEVLTLCSLLTECADVKVAEQRKQAVHKARPVPKYAKLEVKTSTLIFFICLSFF